MQQQVTITAKGLAVKLNFLPPCVRGLNYRKLILGKERERTNCTVEFNIWAWCFVFKRTKLAVPGFK